MTKVGYARVSSTGQDLAVQLEKLEAAGRDKVFKEKRSGVDAGRPELKRCLEYLREGDTLLVTKIDRLARSTSDLYRIVSLLAEKGVAFKVTDDPTIDTTSRTGKLVMGILALIPEFENDIRHERQMDGIKKAKERGVRFGRKLQLVPEKVKQIRKLRTAGSTCPRSCDKSDLAKRVCSVRSEPNEQVHCAKCPRPVIEIDHYGLRLIGCIECNRWSSCRARAVQLRHWFVRARGV
jgi:DNA invertase Pin-like site-specific DNA recombinase